MGVYVCIHSFNKYLLQGNFSESVMSLKSHWWLYLIKVLAQVRTYHLKGVLQLEKWHYYVIICLVSYV